MKIWVKHEVSDHPYSCLYTGGSLMEGREVCKYHKFLTQTHGRKRPPDRQGQTKPVIINHLITEGTVDEDVMRSLKAKDTSQAALLAALKERRDADA